MKPHPRKATRSGAGLECWEIRGAKKTQCTTRCGRIRVSSHRKDHVRLSHILPLGLLCLWLGAGTAFGQADSAQGPPRAAGPTASAGDAGTPGIASQPSQPLQPSQPPSAGAGGARRPAPRLDTRTQYPWFLADSYFTISAGSIHYPFTSETMEPGFRVESIAIRHVAARVTLIGHEFNRYLAAEATYMRPVKFVAYRNVSGDQSSHSVWMNFGSVALKPQLPLGSRVSAYGEVGLGITSRHGFKVNGVPVVRDAHFTSGILGAGIQYHVNRTWDVTAGAHYSPERRGEKQPHTIMWSGGFRYNMRLLPPERAAANRETGYIFPAKLLQFEYTTSAFGYRLNRAVSSKVPLFWGGHVQVAQGGAVHFEQNVFHSRRIFALDLGVSASLLRSRQDHDTFAAVSAYPLLRLTLLRTAPADVYVSYSLAGPTYLSKFLIDDRVTGQRFTFQDMLGFGMFLGRNRRLSAGVRIKHFSNGGIIPDNPGIMVPATLSVGYAF